VQRETSVARKRVEDTGTAKNHKQEDIGNAEMAGFTNWMRWILFVDMLNPDRDSLSNTASSNTEEEREGKVDEEADTELGRLRKDHKPWCVIDTTSISL
jgi:hypothetical protein